MFLMMIHPLFYFLVGKTLGIRVVNSSNNPSIEDEVIYGEIFSKRKNKSR